jgi:hypothetical protein
VFLTLRPWQERNDLFGTIIDTSFIQEFLNIPPSEVTLAEAKPSCLLISLVSLAV